MIRSGLASVTFRKLDCVAVARLARTAGLAGIEWIGDAHAPAGDLRMAREAASATADQGLAVAGYGSYFRAGEKRADLPEFARVLESAVALGAPVIRSWAGLRPSAQADAAYRARVVKELIEAGALARAAGKKLALEYHAGTLTDDDASALTLARELEGSNVDFYWQPHNHNLADNLATLRQLVPRLVNLHVFQWQASATGQDRRPLAEGAAEWPQYLSTLDQSRDYYALLEFVRNDQPELLHADAATLNGWLAALGGTQMTK
ncbi:MAG: sugar phosphate isomerase/epimerase [bacterium]